MSGTKQLPSLKNLRPPYPDYRDRFFTDENNVALRVDDARHGFRHAAKGFAMINAWWLAEAAGLVYDNPNVVERGVPQARGMTGVEPLDTRDRRGHAVLRRPATKTSPSSPSAAPSPTSARGEDADFEHVINDIHARRQSPSPTPFGPSARAGAHRFQERDRRRSGTGWPRISRKSATASARSGSPATASARRWRRWPSRAAASFRASHVHGLYTFGSPLVGDADFKAHFDALLRRYGIEHYRFVNNQRHRAARPARIPSSLGMPPRLLPLRPRRLAQVHRPATAHISDGLGTLFRVSELLRQPRRSAPPASSE